MTIKQVIKNKLDILEFGKFKGKTVRHIIEHEPSYILWLNEEKIVEFPQDVLDKAEDEMFNHDDSYSEGDGWDGDVQD